MEKTTFDAVTGSHTPEKMQAARQLRSQLTPAEKALWFHLRGNRLDGLHFRRQQVIDGFIVDFYCQALGLAIEVDGGIHQSQAEYDRERDRIIQERGIHILRFTNRQVLFQRETVVAEITQCANHLRTRRPS